MTYDLSPRPPGPFGSLTSGSRRSLGLPAGLAVAASVFVHIAIGAYLWRARFETAAPEYSDPVTMVSLIAPAPPPPPPPPPPKVAKAPPKPAPLHRARARIQPRPPARPPKLLAVKPLASPPVLQRVERPAPRALIAPPVALRRPPAAPRPPVITQPDWLKRPSGRDMARFYPDRAQRGGIEGRAVMACRVTLAGLLADCRIRSESPADAGFGAAALKMSSRFKLRPMTRDGKPVAGGTVRIPIQFALPKA